MVVKLNKYTKKIQVVTPRYTHIIVRKVELVTTYMQVKVLHKNWLHFFICRQLVGWRQPTEVTQEHRQRKQLAVIHISTREAN